MIQYVATINVPGYLPMDDDPPVFDEIRQAWDWLADERNRSWNDDDDDQGPDYDPVMGEMGGMVDIGTVYGSTPGYDGDHDLGLAYSVSIVDDTPAKELGWCDHCAKVTTEIHDCKRK